MQQVPTVFVTVSSNKWCLKWMNEWSLDGYRIIQLFILGDCIECETGHWG